MKFHFSYDVTVSCGDEAHYEEFDVVYDYTPSEREVEMALKEYMSDPANLEDVELEDPDWYLDNDDFFDYLWDWCREAAQEAAQNDPEVWEDIADAEEYHRDPYAYYGLSRSDFI